MVYSLYLFQNLLFWNTVRLFKISHIYHMIQQFYFLLYTQEKRNKILHENIIIAALLLLVKIYKQFKCVSFDESLNECLSIQ